MGLHSEIRDICALRKNGKVMLIASPSERRGLSAAKEGAIAGFKAASVACVAAAAPTMIAVRVLPWAKANLNYTAQALIISAASIAAFFITADKTILENARTNSRANYDKLA